MGYTMMVLAARKEGISHAEFKQRYEQHMRLVEDICGDAMPLRHTRWYPQHGNDDKPVLAAGNAKEVYYDVIVTMDFEDKAASDRFVAAVSTPEAAAKIADDEAGFWDRERMHVMAGGDVRVLDRK